MVNRNNTDLIDLRPAIYAVCEGTIKNISRDWRKRMIVLVLLKAPFC